MSDPKEKVSPTPATDLPKPTADEAKAALESARALLERATENVKPLLQKEHACEVISADIWNLRLRCR